MIAAARHLSDQLWGRTELLRLDGPTHVTITVHSVAEDHLALLRRRY